MNQSEFTGMEERPKSAVRKRRFSPVRVLITLLVLYVVFCLLLFVFQRRFVYMGTRGYVATPADYGLTYEDLRLTTSDGETIVAWWVPVDGAKGTILFFHGNGGNLSHRGQTFAALHRLGYAVLMIDYRGYGDSSGSPSEAGLYRDAEAAWAYLVNQRGIPASQIILFGRSLGGGVAVEMATRYRPGGLVVESSFTNLAAVGKANFGFLVPVDLILQEDFASVDKVGEIGCPKLFIHARDDGLIPLAIGRTLYEAAAEPKEFMETPGGHNTGGFLAGKEYATRLARFMDEALAD